MSHSSIQCHIFNVCWKCWNAAFDIYVFIVHRTGVNANHHSMARCFICEQEEPDFVAEFIAVDGLNVLIEAGASNEQQNQISVLKGMRYSIQKSKH